MNLVWKLLRRHISIPQFVGFFFANLFGMLTVLLGIQFYSDIKPVFTAKDSFMKSDYVILSKKIGLGTTLSARSHNFTPDEISKLQRQTFVDTVGTFTSAEYKVEASMGIDLRAVCEQMSRVPPWLPGAVLRADGYETEWYRKD